jgi:dihydrofolate reductase
MINAIFAIDEEGGLGLENTMPWPANQKDLEWFKMHTVGHVVVMGRGTWDAIDMPKPLPRRINWVVTSGSIEPALNGANTWNKDPVRLLYKLEREYPSKIIWVIGGAKLLSSLDGIFDRMYVTQIFGIFGCDVKINFENMSQGYKKIYNNQHFDMEHAIYEKLPGTIS